MPRVAEKVEFILKGREREKHDWNEEWVDRMNYGLLHSIWPNRGDIINSISNA